jgi:hypothetical protein
MQPFLLVAAAAQAIPFRAPAIPLFTTDPYMQTWMMGDNTTSVSEVHDSRDQNVPVLCLCTHCRAAPSVTWVICGLVWDGGEVHAFLCACTHPELSGQG